MKKVLDAYKIKFSSLPNYGYRNKIDANNGWLAAFIQDHYTVNEAKRLLEDIISILNDADAVGGDFPRQSLHVANINCHTTQIFEDDDDVIPQFTLPTQELKVIVEAWCNYLIASPTTAK